MNNYFPSFHAFLKLFGILFLPLLFTNISQAQICPAQADFPFQEWIENVEFGTLTNQNSGKFRDYATAGYSDYTDLAGAEINRNNPVDFRFQAGFSGSSPSFYWTAYIDYNQNNIFDLPQERVVRTFGYIVESTFDIPENALNGATRLRIIASKNGYSEPCENPAIGEVEDYTINIIGNITPPVGLPDLTLSGLNVSTNATENTTVGYTVNLSNIGESGTGDFSVGVFISDDNQLSPDDLLVGEIQVGDFAPGTFFGNYNSSFDLNGIDPGNYFVFFKIDKDEVVEEFQESNNTIRRNLTITPISETQIDLELSLSASVPDPDRFTRSRITLSLNNNSNNTASNVISKFNFSSGDFVLAGNGSVTTTGPGSFSTSSGTWNVTTLAAGATATVSFDLFILRDNFTPCAQVMFADQEDIDSTPGNGQCPNATEDDEANLSDTPPSEPTVDFDLISIERPFSGISGTSIPYAIDYNRTGTLSTPILTQLEVYLSEDEQIDTEDKKIYFNPEFLIELPTDEGNFAGNINLLGVIPGDYFIIADIDRNNAYAELDEENNLISIPFRVTEEAVPDCNTVIGGDKILCSENIGGLTRLYIKAGKNYFTTDLDTEANIIASSPLSPLVTDSTFVKDGILAYKLADGTTATMAALPTAALEFIPNPVAATRLNTGEFVIAGNVRQGNLPFRYETRLLKLDASLNNIITQNILANNTQYPANQNDQVHQLYPLENGEVSIIFSIFNTGVTSIPNVQFRHLGQDLNIITSQSFTSNRFNRVTETPCGDLLLELDLFFVSLRGSTLGSRYLQLSKNGANINSAWTKGVSRNDRVAPREFSNFSTSLAPEFFLNYNSVLDNLPAELTGNLPQQNGDTTQVTFPFFNFNYGTRNDNAAILYGNLNGQITAVTNGCIDSTLEGVDLSVTLEVSNETPAIFSKISYQVTVQNLGGENATNVSIDFDYGAQDTPRRLAFVSSSDPEYSGWRGVWDVGTLAPGAAKTFSLEVFVLSAAGPSTTLFAAVSDLDQEDINGDNDEDTAIINLGANLNGASQASQTVSKSPRLSISQLYPNPAQTSVTLAVESKESIVATELQIFDAFGKLIKQKVVNLETGTNFIQVPVYDLTEGLYMVILPDGSHQNLVKRFVKIE